MKKSSLSQRGSNMSSSAPGAIRKDDYVHKDSEYVLSLFRKGPAERNLEDKKNIVNYLIVRKNTKIKSKFALYSF